jgi:flagellar hook-basal body complex protein FliE
MKLSEVMLSDVAAIRAKFVGGVVSAGPVLQGKEDLRSGITNVTGEFSKMGDTASVRKPVEAGLSDIKKLIDDLKEGDNYTEDVAKYLENSGKLLGKIEEDFKKSLEETGEKISQGFGYGSYEQKLTDMLRGKIGETEASQQAAGNQPISSLLEGKQTQVRDVYATAQAASQNTEVKVQLAGGIEVNFTGAAADLSVQQKEQVTKMVVDRIGSMNWQQFAVNVTTPSNPLKGPVSTAYSA